MEKKKNDGSKKRGNEFRLCLLGRGEVYSGDVVAA